MTWTSTTNRFTVPTGALRMALFLQILDRFPPGRMLDLGTGHGMFARLAADCGWEVTGVDARVDASPTTRASPGCARTSASARWRATT